MKLNRTRKTKSAGFTLIELLIVIIIIGILAAIAFVAYSGTQNRAKKADAEATVAQLRAKLGEYNAEFGYYPDGEGTFSTWLGEPAGGNNDTMAAKVNTGDYTYAPSPDPCTTTACTGYTLTAEGTLFSGTDITVTN